ncbi:MAG: hypothetical protein KDK70_29950, partial [Myxococcales bacterium]|nr:hypothetical protein [Myxococcales bacterium]
MRMHWLLVCSLIVGASGCFEDITGNDPTSTTTTTEGSTADSTTAADSGSGTSGGNEDPCPEYCALVQDVCTDTLEQYQSEALCQSVCAALPVGTADDQLGNTAHCRRFQAIQAAESPDVFCGPAGPTGDGTCGAECEVFCGLAMELCTEDMAQWPDVPSCVADCMQFPNDVAYSA